MRKLKNPKTATRKYALDLPAEPESLQVIRAFAEAISLEAGFDERARSHIQLALEEIALNILMHGDIPDATFKILATLEEGMIQWEILDAGKPFPFERAAAAYGGTPSPDQPLGGIGLFLVKQVMDEVRYESRAPQGNRIVLIKNKENP